MSRFLLCVFALALIHAAFAASWTVYVGWDSSDSKWASLDFIPGVLTINQGDTVTWVFVGAGHTVTFFPTIRSIFADPANLVFDPSILSIPPIPGFNPFDPTTLPHQPAPQVINDTNTLYSSGIYIIPANSTWSATFPNVGSFNYFCLVHPLFLGVVNVLATGATLPAGNTQAAFDAQYAADVAGYLTKIQQLTAATNTQFPPNRYTTNADGTRTYYISVGYGDPVTRLSGNGFFPQNVTARQGDSILFTLGDISGHTLALNQSGIYNDQNGVNAQGEVTGNPFFYRSVGDPTNWLGQFVSAGLFLPAGVPGGVQNFTLTIGTTMPLGAYRFICSIHEPYGMIGTITVVSTSPASVLVLSAAAAIFAALLALYAL